MKPLAVVLLLLALLAVPLATQAQPAARIPRLGWLALGSPTPDALGSKESFLQGLRELGYVEDRNITIEWRWAEGKPERLPKLAAELVKLQVDVIIVGATSSARAGKHATSTIPIVMITNPDPVGAGLVQSLARPGGNVTGMSLMTPELSAKQLELLKELMPTMSRVGVLRDPRGSGHHITVNAAEVAARTLGVDVRVADATGPDDFAAAFSTFRRERVAAVLVLAHPTFFYHRARLVKAANDSRLPVLYGTSEHVHAGGLMSYAASVPDTIRRAAGYVDKILKGTKPADLPVEQPTKFELVINLRTARALRLTIPPAVLARADEVIE